jgi:hypothetical protein
VIPVHDHIRSCQRHLVNYLNNIAWSSKVLQYSKFQRNFIAEYFSSTTLESGKISRYMGHHLNIYHQRTNMTDWLVYSLFCLKYVPMYMQVTSSEKIHKLTPLKFEVLDVARKTINAIPSQYLLNVSGSFYLYMLPLYRVYKKKLNRFEIALNFAKHLFVSGFLYI